MSKRCLAWGIVAVLAAGCATKPVPPEVRSQQSLRDAASLAAGAEKAQQAGQHERAIELGRQAVTLQPSLGAAWNNLGISLMETQQNLDAVQAFVRAAELLPADPKPYENLGLLYMRVGWSEDALRYYGLALERDPYSLPALRGGVAAAKGLLRSEPEGLERCKRGLLVEKDPAWRRLFDTERVRINAELAERTKSLRSAN